ncbi:MAG: Mechanosensitive channel MscK [Flavobacteriaceae bacterium]|nr:MAG: Mechanosensitive channel MscK [Flavobacteriaceae bacterium]
MEVIKNILEFVLISIGEYQLKVISVLAIFLIVAVTKFLLWLIKRSIFRIKNLNHFDEGNTYALFQIIKYVVWIIAISLILETMGVKVTILIAGSAALLVGVGLGLQQTFNDVISGITLLSERSIKIGDVLEIDNDIVTIQEIGLRTSKGLNTDDISIIIPNSLITTNKVINWSYQTKKTRFRIDVGTSYESDIDLVLQILEDCVLDNSDISDTDLIEARLINFGNSSLDFQVLFFSDNIFRINKVKSDIRRSIAKKFAINNISIPFPQIDVHIKSK